MAASLQPLIAICGTTGVGKSKLAIELALRLAQTYDSQNQCHSNKWKGARIINADSMQVYTGMDVITNKIPAAERMGVEHLLMDFKQPGEQYVVGQWVHDAIQAIKETHNQHEIPIVVGGTSYWIQHLLFPNRLSSNHPICTPPLGQHSSRVLSPALEHSISHLPPHLLDLLNNLPEHPPSAASHPDDALLLHRLLQALDEAVAARWHWRDTRKVLRSLHIIKSQRLMPSEIIDEQSRTDLVPRYRTLCFWLHADPVTLNSRLDKRVDDMIRSGLLNEIRALHKTSTSSTSSGRVGNERLSNESMTDYTLGIYQCIGFKEFATFLSDPEASREEFSRAVEEMKRSTRKYAKRQVAWLRNKLLPAIQHVTERNVDKPPIATLYLLDASGKLMGHREMLALDVSSSALGDSWTSNVSQPAQSIMDAFLNEEHLPDPTALSQLAQVMLAPTHKFVNPTTVLQVRRKIVCPVCTMNPSRPVMIEEGAHMEAHRKTRLHKRLAAKLRSSFPYTPTNPPMHAQETDDERWSSSSSFHLPP